MKRLIFCLVLVLCHCNVNAAVVGSYNIEWGYTPDNDPAITGYNIYCDNIWVGFVTGAHAEGGDVVFLVDQRFSKKVVSFTIAANFADGTESGRSAPAVVNNPIFKTGISAPVGFGLFSSSFERSRDWKKNLFKIDEVVIIREKIG